MPRAELHYALALDSEIWDASRVDASLLDPVVRVEGGLPGVARPITIVRDYQGPQGAYTEYFVLRDPQGNELASSPPRQVRLTGEMWTDRVASQARDVLISSADEHQVSLYVNDTEIGTVPVFIEAGLGGDQRVAAQETLKKALGKGAVLWLTVPQPPKPSRGIFNRNGHAQPEHTQAVWFVFEGGKVYVFSGPTEQDVRGLATASEVTLTARSKDLRSQVSQLRAKVRVVPSDDELFTRIGRAGLGRRLNLPDGDGALDRWRQQCALVELTPVFGDEQTSNGRAAGAAEEAGTAEAPSEAPAEQAPAKAKEEEIHVDAQVDQQVFDQLIAEGKSERVARAKAKAAYVRAEKARIRDERAAS